MVIAHSSTLATYLTEKLLLRAEATLNSGALLTCLGERKCNCISVIAGEWGAATQAIRAATSHASSCGGGCHKSANNIVLELIELCVATIIYPKILRQDIGMGWTNAIGSLCALDISVPA
jgi:hypothetical protein